MKRLQSMFAAIGVRPESFAGYRAQLAPLRDPVGLLRHVRRDSLLRNSVFMMAVTVFASLFGFIYWLVAARAYGASEVGLAAALITAMILASMITTLGINTALVQILPRRESGVEWSATLNAGLLTALVSSTIGGLVAVAVLPLVSRQFGILTSSLLFASTFVVGVVATTLTNVLDYACIAERSAGRMLVRNVIFSVVKIPFIVWPVVVGLGTFGILVTWALSSLAILVVMFFLLPRLDRGYQLTGTAIVPEIRRITSYLAGHHAMNIGSFAPWWLLPLLVTAEISATANAYFYASWRIVGLVYMVAPAVSQSLAAEGAADPSLLWRKAASSVRFTGMLLVPAFFALAAVGPFVLSAFGPAYESQGFPLLLLFAAASLPDAVMNIYMGVLRVEGRLQFGGSLQIGCAMLALIGAAAMLPVVGIAGAGVAWLISRVIGCMIIWLDRRRESALSRRMDNRYRVGSTP